MGEIEVSATRNPLEAEITKTDCNKPRHLLILISVWILHYVQDDKRMDLDKTNGLCQLLLRKPPYLQFADHLPNIIGYFFDRLISIDLLQNPPYPVKLY